MTGTRLHCDDLVAMLLAIIVMAVLGQGIANIVSKSSLDSSSSRNTCARSRGVGLAVGSSKAEP